MSPEGELVLEDPFVCDGRVNEEKLRELLAVQTETASLDYKQTYDLTRSSLAVLHFVHDSAAMMSRPAGGYLVVGVDGAGKPLEGNKIQRDLFDEVRLRPHLERYLSGPLVVRSAVHTLDEGAEVAIIYLGPCPDGLPPVFTKIGQHRKDGQKDTVVFREGEIVVRAGTQNRCLHREDLPRLVQSHIDGAREDERRRMASIVAHLQDAFRGARVADAPMEALSWELPDEEFRAAVGELIRRDDMSAIRNFLVRTLSEARRLTRTTDAESDFTRLLDKVTILIAAALEVERPDYFTTTLKTLARIYTLGSDNQNNSSPRRDLQVASSWLWREIIIRVEALGGMAVRLEAWWAVRQLTLQQIGRDYPYYSWLRHGLTWAYREGSFKFPDNLERGAVLILLARQQTSRLEALRPDFAWLEDAYDPTEVHGETDDLLNSICQFDLLWCLITAEYALDRERGGGFYPSFSGLYEYRTTPILDQLVDDGSARGVLLGGASRDRIVLALRQVLDLASREGFRYGHWDWERLLDDLVARLDRMQ